eukprot:115493-Rhodomonas_salina.1
MAALGVAADAEEDRDAVVVTAALLLRNFSAGIVNNRHIRVMIPNSIPEEVHSSSPLPIEADDESFEESTASSPGKISEASGHRDAASTHPATCNCPLDSAICENAAALRAIFFAAVKEENDRILRLFELCCLQDARLRSLFWAREHGNSGKTALQLAASLSVADSVETVAEVLAGDSEKVDATDESGLTAFMMAARAGCFDAVKILDSFGAQRSLRSASGKRASDYAEESGNAAMAEYFQHPKPSGKGLMDFQTKMQRCKPSNCPALALSDVQCSLQLCCCQAAEGVGRSPEQDMPQCFRGVV